MDPAHPAPAGTTGTTRRTPAPPTLWLARPTSAEGRHAPEFEYLTSWVDLQVRRAFGGDREIRHATPDAIRQRAADGDRVLWLASERVLVARATLASFARRLEDETACREAGGVAATPLATLPGLADQPVYTLAGFERWEGRCLEVAGRTDPGVDDTPVDTPVHAALLTGSAFRRLEGGALPPLPRTGVSHEFIDYYGEVRRDVLPHVPAAAGKILEVGCGRGVTGEMLRSERGATVVGVELNPVVAREAEGRLDAVVTGDVEDAAVARRLREHGPFDLVLALELFEHLARPEDFLLRAAELLAPDGAILLSTPNVGHYSVVQDLLAGRWDYLPVGLLCYTHLRFFTRRTLEDWLGRLGFESFRLIPQTTEDWPRLEAVERALGESTPGERSSECELDRDSLRTQGFFVLIERRGMIRREDRRMSREKRHDP